MLLQKFWCLMIRTPSQDPDKVIFNLSVHVLKTTHKSLLSKELNFAIPPKNINYDDYMLPFELLYREVDSLEVSNLVKEFIKSRSETP